MQPDIRSFPIMFKAISLHAGDIESMPFIEALGQFSYRVGKAILYASHETKMSMPFFV